MMQWPAVLNFRQDDELTYIRDEQEWNDLRIELLDFVFDEHDQLIDSTGMIFSIKKDSSGGIVCLPTAAVMPLVELLGLIKAHAAQNGSCCVAKFYAADYDAAFEVLRTLD